MGLNYLFFIPILIITWLRSFDDLHKFQQNSYRIKRYFRWKNASLSRYIKPHEIIYLLGLALVFDSDHLLVKVLGLIFIGVDYYFFSLIKTAQMTKKALAMTARVKRLVFTNTVLLVVIAIVTGYYAGNLSDWGYLALGLIYLLSFVVTLASALINAPIESRINQYYYDDAQKVLAKNPHLKVIGITGSYGKTSTKNVIGAMLSRDFNVLTTPESYNTKMGLTRTIREQLKPTHQVFIAEMGAKEVGDIKELCDFVHPTMGIITSIGPQHLETFKTLENVISTKGELFAELPAGGIAFRNLDDDNIAKLPTRQDISYVTYSTDEVTIGADYTIEDISLSSSGSSFTLNHKPSKKRVRLNTKLLGRHNLTNILAGVAVALELGVSMDRLNTLIAEVKPVPHRLSTRRVANTYTVLDDAFNSNPIGSKMALEVLKGFDGNRKFIITPGMIELGDQQETLNRAFGHYMADACDYVILVGKQQTQPIQEGLADMAYPADQIYIATDLKDAFAKLESMVQTDDVVLIENDLPDTFNEKL